VKTYSSCHGCDLCLLGCPVWRATRDMRLTPHGRAKALQHGATVGELAASLASCTLCGACEPICPEEIPLVDLVIDLRGKLPLGGKVEFFEVNGEPATRRLLPGKALRDDVERLVRIAGLLDLEIAADDGSDISEALEQGATIPPLRLEAFLKNLDSGVVVADGLLLHQLRKWLPRKRFQSLGEALSAHDAIRAQLRASDLYVIEPRAYHAQHARLVRYYDKLRTDIGFSTNLDLQRLAVPPVASAEQARWIMEGRTFERVVVEDPGDRALFASVTDRPVVHVGDLA
jgi:ferredoxin